MDVRAREPRDTRDSEGDAGGGDATYNLTFNISAPDSVSVERFLEDDFLPAFEAAVRRNRGGIRSALENMLD